MEIQAPLSEEFGRLHERDLLGLERFGGYW
jgi:hypothetical protein